MNLQDLQNLVIDRAKSGEFNVHRDLFRDPEIFELEMRHIFESTWVFLGLESQAPATHDYFTTWIGRQPVVVMRGADGVLRAFFNTCRHRGALVCHLARGNAKLHTCNYHGWVYDSAGNNRDIKDRKQGGYSAVFDGLDHGLIPVPRFSAYRGLLFGSVNPDVPPLETHLGDVRTFLDMVIDQSPQGVELIPGSSTYTYNANWKFQLENCVDSYHFTSTHPSFMKIVERRSQGESKHKLKALDITKFMDSPDTRGTYTFAHGHAMIWGFNPAPEVRPLYANIEELRARVGAKRADWMLATRNLTVFPNAQFAENASLQLRVIRPLAVDKTEMTIHCLAPVGEASEAREQRIRQYEDFFNSTGLATPDDTVTYEDCQAGFAARTVGWSQGYMRGLTLVCDEPNDPAKELGVAPATSVTGRFEMQDETVFHGYYREWLRLMERGMCSPR